MDTKNDGYWQLISSINGSFRDICGNVWFCKVRDFSCSLLWTNLVLFPRYLHPSWDGQNTFNLKWMHQMGMMFPIQILYLWVHPQPSNSHHKDYYIFSSGSLSTFSFYCYWVGGSANLCVYIMSVCVFMKYSSWVHEKIQIQRSFFPSCTFLSSSFLVPWRCSNCDNIHITWYTHK